MSREQWGHGYYQGRRDAFKPDVLKQWVAIYSDEGELEYAGRVVQTYPNDHILLEFWDVFDLNYFLFTGKNPAEDIDRESLIEVRITAGSKFFASFSAFLNEVCAVLHLMEG